MKDLMPIYVPRIGTNEDSVEIVELTVDDLGLVKSGDVVAVVETTKTTFEVPSKDFSGYVRYTVGVGEVVAIGDPIAFLSPDREKLEHLPKSIDKPPEIVSKSSDLSNIVAEGIQVDSMHDHGIAAKNLFIWGAGAGGAVALQTANSMGLPVNGYIDESAKQLSNRSERFFQGLPVFAESDLSFLRQALHRTTNIFVAVANGLTREMLCKQALEAGFNLISLVHASVVVDSTSHIGAAVHIKTGVCLDPFCQIKTGSIIDLGVNIAHHSVVNQFVHLAPGCTLGSNVEIGRYTLVGSGAIIHTGIKVGSNVIIAPGKVVDRDLPNGTVVA